MFQRMRDAATLLFLGALVLTIKATPVEETMGALTPHANAAAAVPAEQTIDRPALQPPARPVAEPAPSMQMGELTATLELPVSPDRMHAVLDLSRLAELSELAEVGQEIARRVIVLQFDTENAVSIDWADETCPHEHDETEADEEHPAADRC